jgi:hypothetical protein
LGQKSHSFTFVVAGVVVVVVEVVVDVLVVDVLVKVMVVEVVVLDALKVEVLVIVETTTSVCDVSASESASEVAALDIGATSSGTTCSFDTSAGCATTVDAVVSNGGRVFGLLMATVVRFVVVPVTLTANHLDTVLQRCLPQHRTTQKRTFCTPVDKLYFLESKIWCLLIYSVSNVKNLLG